MTAARLPKGLYRTGSYETGDAAAFVDGGSMGFEVNEARYRDASYSPPFDSLPTKKDFEANGGVAPRTAD